jgi:tol-pal system protein YbgF
MRPHHTLSLVLFLVPALVTLLVGSPASGATASKDALNEKVAELERRVLELQKLATVSEVELARLRDRLIDLENELLAERAARSEAAERSGPVVDEVPIRVEVPGRIQEEDLDEPVLVAEPPPLRATEVASAPETTAAPADAAPADAGLPVSAAGQELYDQGYTLYHQGQHVEAEASFQRFLAAHGDTELADNALYWIGESRYSRTDYRGALAAFREAAERYPKGNKVPDALLKAGAALEKLGDYSGARQSYRDIQRRFPDSATALVAAERIARLP